MGRAHDVVKLVHFISVGSRGDTSPSLWNGHTKVNAALHKGYKDMDILPFEQRLQIVQHFQLYQLPHVFGLSHHPQKLNTMSRFIEKITKQFAFPNSWGCLNEFNRLTQTT